MRIKRLLTRLLIGSGVLLCLALLAYTFFVSANRVSNADEGRLVIPKHTKVKMINEEAEESFINPQEVVRLLPFDAKDTLPVKVNTHRLESLLIAKSSYISDVNIYIAPLDKSLNIRITQRQPLIRYFHAGHSYYIDRDGWIFENRTGASAHVPLATGDVSIETAQSLLFPLGQFMMEHEVWREFIGAIHIPHDGGIYLYPRVGDYVFVIDDLEDIEDKLSKIPIFYKTILPRVGAEKYKIINLSYKKQIVCKYR